jgi:serpin B
MLLLLLACHPSAGTESSDTSSAPASEVPGVTLAGSVPRDTSPSSADVPALGTANADFTLDVQRALYAKAPTTNLVWSPWSLQVVMAQVHAGAAGDAKSAIASTFHWTLDDAALNDAFNAASLAVDAHHDPASDPPVSLTSTSQIFVTDGYPLGADWLDTLSASYGTGVQQMDFAGDPTGVAADINAWIDARTGGHIDELVSAEMVASSRLLLANALFFAASWAVPFVESSTADAPFTLLDGSTAAVPTMSGTVAVQGARGDGYLVAELPYSDGGLVMTLVVPDAGRFAELAGTLEWGDVSTVLDGAVACAECPVQLPKFEIHSAPPLEETLRDMGLEPAFGGAYPGINEGLTLTGLAQNGFIVINEKGTEAAAATVVSFSDSAGTTPLDEIIVDRPFFWFVREVGTGAMLFAGVVVDPR